MFYPCFAFDRVSQISCEFLAENNISSLILDLDNTLTTHNNPNLPEDIANWLSQMRAGGIKLIILSNNSSERVRPFAEAVGLDFVAHGAKPLSKGLREAMARLGSSRQNSAIVGDQVFTDVLCGNLAGVRSVLLKPIEYESFLFFKLKRLIEKPIISAYNRKTHRKEKKK